MAGDTHGVVILSKLVAGLPIYCESTFNTI